MTAAGHAMCDAPACRLIKFPVASIPQALHMVHPIGASLLAREYDLGVGVGPHNRRPGERPWRIAQHLALARRFADHVFGLVAVWIGSVPHGAVVVCQDAGRGVCHPSCAPPDFARFHSQLLSGGLDGGGPSLVRTEIEDGRCIVGMPPKFHLVPRCQRAAIRQLLAVRRGKALRLRRRHHCLLQALPDFFEAVVVRLQFLQPRQWEAKVCDDLPLTVRLIRASSRREGVRRSWFLRRRSTNEEGKHPRGARVPNKAASPVGSQLAW